MILFSCFSLLVLVQSLALEDQMEKRSKGKLRGVCSKEIMSDDERGQTILRKKE